MALMWNSLTRLTSPHLLILCRAKWRIFPMDKRGVIRRIMIYGASNDPY